MKNLSEIKDMIAKEYEKKDWIDLLRDFEYSFGLSSMYEISYFYDTRAQHTHSTQELYQHFKNELQ